MERRSLHNLAIALFLLCLFASSPALGGWTEAGGGTQFASVASNQSLDSVNLPYPGNVTAGCTLTVGGAIYTSGTDSAPIVITDDVGTIYTPTYSFYDGTNVTVFTAEGVGPSSAANSVTVNPEGSGSYISFAIKEFCGGNNSDLLDVDGGSSSGTGTTISDSLTTANANALILAAMSHTGSSTFTTDSPLVEIAQSDDNSCCQAFAFAFQIATTATTYTPTFTAGDSVPWMVYTIALKELQATTAIRHKVSMQ